MPIQKSAVKHYLKLASLLSVQFIVIYGGAIWFSEQRDDVHRIYFEWERSIPLVPSMIWVYFSVTPLMLLPAILLDIEQLNRLAKQMMLAMLIAGVVFLIFPATIGYPPPENPPAAIEILRSIDRPYNLVPSLHVALSLIIMRNLHPVFDARGKALLGIWMIALVVSVLLTHQHHLADVLGGLLLALICEPLVPRNSRQ
jgi:hypothetical protein